MSEKKFLRLFTLFLGFSSCYAYSKGVIEHNYNYLVNKLIAEGDRIAIILICLIVILTPILVYLSGIELKEAIKKKLLTIFSGLEEAWVKRLKIHGGLSSRKLSPRKRSTLLIVLQKLIARLSREPTPISLSKLLTPDEWKHAEGIDPLPRSRFDRNCIRLLKSDQLEDIIKNDFQAKKTIILMISTKKLNGNLRYEPGASGQNYYYLHDGEITADAIEGTIEFNPNPEV